MLRSVAAALAGLLLVPALALAAEGENLGDDKTTEAMFVLIIGAILILALLAVLEARRQR